MPIVFIGYSLRRQRSSGKGISVIPIVGLTDDEIEAKIKLRAERGRSGT